MRSQAAILTGGGDRPYALGLAFSLVDARVPFDFIGSDFLESEELRSIPSVRFLNLRGDMDPAAARLTKVLRVAKYYARLIAYAWKCEPNIFHLLWNNKVEMFDRTLLMLYYRTLGKRIVLTIHNVNIRARDGRDSFLNRLTLRIQYRLADHLFVHTQKMKDDLVSAFGVHPARVTVIPFGINDTIPKSDLTGDQARRRLGLEPTHKVVLFFGNIAPYKGLEYLVEAFAVVAREERQARLIIAGRPKGAEEYWDRISHRISELSLRDRAILSIEYVPDDETEVYFKAADVFALPYTYIYQSGVLFLGYSFGLPVIASDVGALRDDVVEGETGLLTSPASADSLAGALARFLAEPAFSRWTERRSQIRAFAKERYSWAKVAEITKRVYIDLRSPRTVTRLERS